jgi:hypothetical protein
MRASRTMLSLLAAGAVVGCSPGGQQSAFSQSNAPRHLTVSQAQSRTHGWMLRGAKSTDLLYVSNADDFGPVLVLTYPKGALAGQVTVPTGIPEGLCSDSAGDVFVTTYESSDESYIYKYAHGGTEPTATLSDPGAPQGCAIDPTTGDLAVTNNATASYGPGNVIVYAAGQSVPTQYSDPNVRVFLFCAYDEKGDLFADGDGALDMLLAGGQSLNEISLNQPIDPSSIQWVTKDRRLAVVDYRSPPSQYDVYQIKVSGSTGTVTGPIILKTGKSRRDRSSPDVQFWTGDERVIGPANLGSNTTRLDFWRYPGGGWPTKSIHRPGGAFDLFGVAFSRAGGNSVGMRRRAYTGGGAAAQL